MTPLIIHFIRRSQLFLVFIVLFALAPAVYAEATPPTPVMGPRLHPPPIPHPQVLEPEVIADHLLSPPAPALEANAYGGAQPQEDPGRGVDQTASALGEGLTLFPGSDVCSDFNRRGRWSTRRTGIWTAYYGGWGPFAVDNDYYHAENVVFSQELVVGPGRSYANNQSSVKIASSQPYAAGIGSPLLKVRPGATVTVTVSYLIYDHGQGGSDLDWASMGIKADAIGGRAEYVNGYVRGRWAELSHSIKAGPSGLIMVLLQAQSPAALNSNIYFDNVKIQINGRYLGGCF